MTHLAYLFLERTDSLYCTRHNQHTKTQI